MDSNPMKIWCCIASGPSLIPNDLDFVRDQGWSIATVNMGYTICPDAKVFHAMDSEWWKEYEDEVFDYLNPQCQLWTGCKTIADSGRARLVTWDGEQGWSDKQGHVHGGKLSGLQLINIVGWYKPDLIVLLGYDNAARHGQQHWHPDYPEHMKNVGVVDQQAGDYAKLWESSPIPIVNCSRRTMIDSIPRMKLEDVPNAISEGFFKQDARKEHQETH